MTGQTAGAIIQDLSMPSLLDAESRPQGGAGSFTDEAVSILTSTSQLARTLLGRTLGLKCKESFESAEGAVGSSCDEDSSNSARRKREFIPSEKKDDSYWDKRKKNNEAAKRSREKRRANDMVLERRVLGLLEENARLRAELLALKFRFGLVKDPSEVSILPLSAARCASSAPTATHYYQAHSGGSSYVNTQTSSGTQTPHYPQQAASYGQMRAVESILSHSASEESHVSTSCSSNMSSPVFFDDSLGECGRVSPRELAEEQQGCGSHTCPVEVTETQYIHRQDSPEVLRSLPHKLRFKVPGGSSDGGEMSLTPDSRHSSPPVAMDGPNIHTRNHQQAAWEGRTEAQAPFTRECSGQQYQGPSSGYYNSSFPTGNKHPTEDLSLKSQISCLSQEVAQLKKLFSQQLLSKIV
ncbi:nuclear factor interleukin-3-regulated protein-like [Parambassis ranga]|uniref:Nuclear factor interleukin-3-regulated protein-like n=1 Tax=Parambassis ranga TaxID=210632 RepID=A0A6P7IAI7_9TELE|nr:nuclear factor interleukin-3-regulated protein-like [Parambassis ranga]